MRFWPVEVADAAGDRTAARDGWEQAGRAYDQSQQPEKAVYCFKRAGRVDLAQRTAAAVSDFSLKRTLLHAVFGPLEYAQWLEGEGRLTEAAAARRLNSEAEIRAELEQAIARLRLV